MNCSSMYCMYMCMYFEPTMLTELLYMYMYMYPLQYGYTPLHDAAKGGYSTIVKHLLSTPGIDVNIKCRPVSWPLCNDQVINQLRWVARRALCAVHA